MDRGAWQVTVHGVAKGRMQLNMHAQGSFVRVPYVVREMLRNEIGLVKTNTLMGSQRSLRYCMPLPSTLLSLLYL